MAELVDDVKQAVSSAAEPSDVTPDSSPEADVKPTESPSDSASSQDDSVDKPKSMLEAVSNALVKEPKADEVAVPEDKAAATEQKAEGQDPKISLELKDYQKTPFGHHPRFRQVLKHARELQEKNAVFEAKSQEFAAKEQTIANFEAFRGAVQQADLSSDDVAQAFLIASLIKSDPAKALEALNPIIDNLTTLTGNRLPGDLQAKVDQGLIDEETAFEVSRDRASAVLATNRSTKVTERSQAQVMDQQREAVRSKVQSWEDAWKSQDPDYGKKQQFVESEVRQMISKEGFPATPDDAVRMSIRARQVVEDRLNALRPVKASIRTVTGASGAVTNGAQPVPKSMLEAVRLGLARTHTQ